MDSEDLTLMFYAFQNDFGLAMLGLAVLFGFILAFAVGANDSANSWGTPVGAGTVSFGVAVILGSITEILGAVILSGGVVSGISGSSSIVNIEKYQSTSNETEFGKFQNGTEYLEPEKALMIGMLVSMVASYVWQLACTYLAWPVSGSHAIISALFGFTLMENGADGINVGNAEPWCASGIYKVIYGLFVSPFIALFWGLLVYFLIYKFAVSSGHPRDTRNKIWFTMSAFFMATAIGFQFSTAKVIKEDQYLTIIDSNHCFSPNKKLFGIIVGLVCGLVTAIIFHFILLESLLNAKQEFKLSLSFITKRLKKDDDEQIDIKIPECRKISKNLEISDATTKVGTNGNGHANNGYVNNYTKEDLEKQEEPIKDQEFEMGCDPVVPNEHDEVKKVFRPLQVVAAAFAALNHGGNDVGNCIGPLVMVWYIYKNPLDFSNHSGDGADATFWLIWGGIGISLGLLSFGRRVIMTLGTKITPMTPSLGFVSVMSSTTIVMLCTLLGIPVSTTQCQVMAVVGGGIARGWIDHGSFKSGLDTVDIKVFRNIGLSWICTIPFSGFLSACLYAAVRRPLLGPLPIFN